jgi:hypothetical protein
MRTGYLFFSAASFVLLVIFTWGSLVRFPILNKSIFIQKYDEKIDESNAIDVKTIVLDKNATLKIDTKAVRDLQIDFEKEVLIDPTIEGIEISGDTTLINRISRSVSQNKINLRFTNAKYDPEWPKHTRDSIRRIDSALFAKPLIIKIGQLPKIQYCFLNCKSIKTLYPWKSKKKSIIVDSHCFANLELDMQEFIIDSYDKKRESSVILTNINLSGQVETLKLRDFSNFKIDANALATRDIYCKNLMNSQIDIAPKEILNLEEIKGSTINLHSKPKYRRLKDISANDKGEMSKINEL